MNQFNIHFGYPRSDTCDTCDSLKIRIDAAETEEEWQEHLRLAEQGYTSLHKDCEKCKESWSHVDQTM